MSRLGSRDHRQLPIAAASHLDEALLDTEAYIAYCSQIRTFRRGHHCALRDGIHHRKVVGSSASAGLVAAAFVLAASTSAAQLIPCWGQSNNGAGVPLSSQSASKGLTGRMDLLGGTPHAGASIAHPTQIVASNGDFVGFGTYKGAGTLGGVRDCPATSGDRWAVYNDFSSFGHYFCYAGLGSEPNVAANQTFEIKHTACPSTGNTEFVMSWNGSFKACVLINAAGGTPVVGGESVGYDPQDIDVHYELLQYRVLGGTWTNWTTVPAGDRCVNSGYTLTTTNASTDWTMVH